MPLAGIISEKNWHLDSEGQQLMPIPAHVKIRISGTEGQGIS